MKQKIDQAMESFLEEWMWGVIFFVLMVGVVVSIVMWSLLNGISPMPTSSHAKASLLSLLPNELQGTIYELGSGWGTLLFPLAKKYTVCQVVGLETSPIPYYISWLWLQWLQLSHVKLIRQDFFTVNLNDASLVVCYLYPKAMEKLKVKFLAELKPGTFVASNTFAVPGWHPETVIGVGDLYHTKVYLYRVPEKGA